MRLALLLPLALLATACANTQVTKTGPTYPPTDPASIKVFLTKQTDCTNLEELGAIMTPLKWNQEKAIEDAKVNAGRLGATHIRIINMANNAFNDARVSVIAYRCTP